MGSLGFFGGIHFDDGDHAAFVTAMVYNQSVPSSWRNGLFHLLDFGIYVAPDPHSILYFSGLHYHAGTSPTPPPGVKPTAADYRFTVVCYPSNGILTGKSPTAFAPLPNGGVLHISPEMQLRQGTWLVDLKMHPITTTN